MLIASSNLLWKKHPTYLLAVFSIKKYKNCIYGSLESVLLTKQVRTAQWGSLLFSWGSMLLGSSLGWKSALVQVGDWVESAFVTCLQVIRG